MASISTQQQPHPRPPPPHPLAAPQQDPHPESTTPLNSKTSDELLGAPFDGTAILNRIEATKSPTPAQQLIPHRPAPPRPSRTSPDAAAAMPPPTTQPPSLRQSASFSSGGEPLSEKVPFTRTESAKRFSDEAKEPKMSSVLRKKSGFSGFMNSLVGSPKKPLISAPENPVHVTHVGYDSSTGQFTVRITNSSLLPKPLLPPLPPSPPLLFSFTPHPFPF